MTRRLLSRYGVAAFLIAAPPGASAEDPAALTAILEETRTELKMPGLRAAVRFPDGRVVRAAVGLADREADIPLDDRVRMPGGSTGKTFAAALTMLLVEDGVLSLDDPASKWLGDRDWYRRLPNADAIRVRHLLSHSAGLGDYPGTMRFRIGMVWRAIRRSGRFEPEELIGFIGRRPRYPAGRGYAYTDAGYLVLGRVIEAAAGRAYYDLLRERILEPHGLDEIGLQDRSVLPGITPGYTMGARNLRDDGTMKFDPSSEWTGGGLTTNPTMLVRVLRGARGGADRAAGDPRRDAGVRLARSARRRTGTTASGSSCTTVGRRSATAGGGRATAPTCVTTRNRASRSRCRPTGTGASTCSRSWTASCPSLGWQANGRGRPPPVT